MRTLLFVSIVVLVGCGGTSRNQGGSRGDGSNGGNAGDDSGAGGRAGTAGTAGTSGTAGVAAGANGGTGARGGSGGDAGETSAGEPGTGATDGGVVAGRGGTGGTGGADATGGNAGAAAMPSITSCSETFRFEGVWEGNILDFYFAPVESVRMVVTPDEQLGGYQATFTIGSGDPPPPVTSGDEPYPNREFWGDDGADPYVEVQPWPGFAHSVVRGAGCDAVLRVSISAGEPWDEWCSLQEPVYTDGQGWGCTLRGGGSSGGGMCDVQDGRGNVLATYPLWKCAACGAYHPEFGVCGCTEDGCSFNRIPTHTYELQSTVDNVISGPDPRCSDCTVRLTRVE